MLLEKQKGVQNYTAGIQLNCVILFQKIGYYNTDKGSFACIAMEIEGEIFCKFVSFTIA